MQAKYLGQLIVYTSNALLDIIYAKLTIPGIAVPDERKMQDYRSGYLDIRDWLRREQSAKESSWDDVAFEIDLLKSQEINLDDILE